MSRRDPSRLATSILMLDLTRVLMARNVPFCPVGVGNRRHFDQTFWNADITKFPESSDALDANNTRIGVVRCFTLDGGVPVKWPHDPGRQHNKRSELTILYRMKISRCRRTKLIAKELLSVKIFGPVLPGSHVGRTSDC